MAEIRLKADKRLASGKGVARKSRAAGRVPAIVYGEGMEPVAIEVDRREFVSALRTDAGMNVLLDLEIDGTTTLALTRELQRDPVKGTLLHADFVKVDRTHAIELEVPVHVVGESPGVKEGGALEHPLFQVHVKCLPTDVPESIDADISGLGIGDTLRVSDLARGSDFEILTDPETVVALVTAPISEEELVAMAAAAVEGAGGTESVDEAEPRGDEAEEAEGDEPGSSESTSS